MRFRKGNLISRVLQAAYRLARLDGVRLVERSQVQIDPTVVQERLEQAVQKLQDFFTLKRKLTGTITEVGEIR